MRYTARPNELGVNLSADLMPAMRRLAFSARWLGVRSSHR